MFNKIYEKCCQFIKENYKFILSLIAIFIFFFYELPFVVYKPGGTIDLNTRIEIEGKYESSGSLNMAYVSMMRGNIPFVLLSYFIPNWDLEKTSNITVNNESIDDSIKRDRIYLENGLDYATFNAYREAGKEIKITNVHQIITYIAEEAITDLELGDKILSINNHEFKSLNELQLYINTLKKEETVHFKVLRGDKEKECTAKIFELDNSLKVGISIVEKYDYTTNPKLEIKTKASESGSSGGLMTALAIYNALTEEDLTKGRKIVGTGAIDKDGNILEIGGVKYKLLGAEKAKADIFLCPEKNFEEALRIKDENKLNLNIIKVETLKEAIEELQK